MSNDTTQPAPKPTKQTAPKQPDDAPIRVKELLFRGSVDVPSEQQVARLTTKERSGRPRYEIWFVPKQRMYLVRAFDPRMPGDEGVQVPTHTFLVPVEMAVAEVEAA